MTWKALFFSVLALLTSNVYSDTPANCTYDEIIGSWTFYLGENGHSNYDVDCSKVSINTANTRTLKVDLTFPDIAVDEKGNTGTWTVVYNQGFNVILDGVRYFAFSNWKAVSAKKYVSLCHQTHSGWFHNVYDGYFFPVKNWGCFKGAKKDEFKEKLNIPLYNLPDSLLMNKKYLVDKELIEKINTAQSSWKATFYDHYNKMTLAQMRRRRGSFSSGAYQPPKPIAVTNETLQIANSLPKSLDWRAIDGINYVSPIRNQGSCGSCYAFASMAMLEARIRIQSKNQEKPVLSTQNIVGCGNYSQGCEGGFPYFVAGTYSTDFGNIEEKCFPYTGKDGACKPAIEGCKKYYVKSYNYVGGFCGGSNEPLMRIELAKNGPIAVGINVMGDFEHYKGGIYHHTGLSSRFDPTEPMNHAVLVVGYGQDRDTGENYWIVKNSWGEKWGEDGYFRIRRGTDEIAIESLGFAAVPHL